MSDEPRLSLTEARSEFERQLGRAPSLQTVRRWARSGVNGVRLEAREVGRFWTTTAGAIERFLAETTAGVAV